MYVTIEDFMNEWKREAELTQKMLDTLTDASLDQQVYAEGRTLGRIAWHLTTNIPVYLTHFGLKMATVEDNDEVPRSAKEIAETFKTISANVLSTLEEQWADDDLKSIQNAFGREESTATIFMGLIKHIAHHRGQLTVLLRQAGLKPSWVYGPPKEDWTMLNVDTPPL